MQAQHLKKYKRNMEELRISDLYDNRLLQLQNNDPIRASDEK